MTIIDAGTGRWRSGPMHAYFMKTSRIGFSTWNAADLDLAEQLWGEPEVTRFICAAGRFTKQDIANRFHTEMENETAVHIQYWPIFELVTGELIGCCGLRPFPGKRNAYELGFHLRKEFWRKGFGEEAAKAAITYGFQTLAAEALYAGHHPQNTASEKLLLKLGFQKIGNLFYEPTGLYHPSYKLEKCAL